MDRLVPSNPDFRRIKLDDLREHRRNVQLLDGICFALTTRVVYVVLGMDESDMEQVLRGRTVFAMWTQLHQLAPSISFFNRIDASTAKNVGIIEHALVLHAKVKHIGGIDYMMLQPRRLTLVQVFGHFLKSWVRSHYREIKSCARRRRDRSS